MRVIVSDTNLGPVVNIAAWLGMTVMVLSVCTRLWSKYSFLRTWSIDDALIIVVAFMGCLFTITVSMTVANGLGTPQSVLNDRQIVKMQKWGYATELLYIPTLFLTKVTTLVYLRALAPETNFAIMNTLLAGLITMWGLGVEFAIAFQCKLPSPWAWITGNCFNMFTFWTANAAFDIFSDVAIILLSIYLVWPLRMSWKRKIAVIVAFGSRVLVIPVTGWRIYSMTRFDPNDATLSSYYYFLTAAIHLNFAIFMTCVAFLRPLMEAMSSGGISRTTYIPSTKASSSKSNSFGSKFSSLLSSRTSRQTPKPKSAYRMENLSEVGLHENSGTFGKADSTTGTSGSIADIPSIHLENGNHVVPMPAVPNTISCEELGPLRPDRVMSFSRVSLPLDGNNTTAAESGEMGITRIREWGVREEYKHAKSKKRDPEP